MLTESEPVKTFRDGRQVCDLRSDEGRTEYRRRVTLMWERQHHVCCLCYKPIRLTEAVFEHENGRGMGGGIRNDAIALPDGTWINGASCWECNGRKASKRGRYNP